MLVCPCAIVRLLEVARIPKMAEKHWRLLDKREIEQSWPLHFYIFEERCEEFKKVLEESKVRDNCFV